MNLTLSLHSLFIKCYFHLFLFAPNRPCDGIVTAAEHEPKHRLFVLVRVGSNCWMRFWVYEFHGSHPNVLLGIAALATMLKLVLCPCGECQVQSENSKCLSYFHTIARFLFVWMFWVKHPCVLFVDVNGIASNRSNYCLLIPMSNWVIIILAYIELFVEL